MKKIVINSCPGGFSVSEAVYKYLEIPYDGYGYLTDWKDYGSRRDPNLRQDPELIEAIEILGSEKTSGPCADLSIVEIPDHMEFTIEERNGNEWVAEVHRTWR